MEDKKNKNDESEESGESEDEETVNANQIEGKKKEIEYFKEKLEEVQEALRDPKLVGKKRDAELRKINIFKKKIQERMEDISGENKQFSFKSLFLLILLIALIYSKITVENHAMYSTRAKFDFYEKLELKRSATEKEIKKNYKKLMVKFHPDRNPDCKDCERKVYDIHTAFEVLSNPKKREIYDKTNKIFEEISSKAVDLKGDNFEMEMQQNGEVRIVQIYDSTRASENFSVFFEELQQELDFIGFYRVHKQQEGYLLKQLPYSAPFSPFLYIENPLEKTQDVLNFLKRSGSVSKKLMISSFMNMVPRSYSKYSKQQWDQDPLLHSKYQVKIFSSNISMQPDHIKARILYYSYLMKKIFGVETALIKTKGFKSNQLYVDFHEQIAGIQKYKINLRSVRIGEALDLVMKSVFIRTFSEKNQNGVLSKLWRKDYNLFCRSKIAVLINTRCFVLGKFTEAGLDLNEAIENQNSKVAQKFSGEIGSKGYQEIMNQSIDFLSVSTASLKRQNRILKDIIQSKIEKQVRMEISQQEKTISPEEAELQIEDRMKKFSDVAMIYFNGKQNEIHIIKQIAEIEDAYERINNMEVEFGSIFSERNLDGIYFEESDDYWALLVQVFRKLLWRFDVGFWLLLIVVVSLRFWINLPFWGCVGLYFVVVIGRSVFEVNEFVLN